MNKENERLIPYSTLPQVTQSRLIHEPFWRQASNRLTAEIKNRSVIVLENEVDKYVTNLPNTLPVLKEKWPFYLQHQDLFERAQQLYSDVFGVMPDTLLLHIYKEDDTVSAFFFTSSAHLEAASKNIVLRFPLGKILNDELNKKLDKKKKSLKKQPFLTDKISELNNQFVLPQGVYPIIGAFNDLTGNKVPNFSLLLGSVYDEDLSLFYKANEYDNFFEEHNETESLLPIDDQKKVWSQSFDLKLKNQFFSKGFPVYCIKRINLADWKLTEKYNPDNMELYYRNTIDLASDEFKATLFYLTLGNLIGKHLTLNQETFTAIMPHFYKLDRTVTSVSKHSELRRLLSEKYRIARKYSFGLGIVNISHFIQFFIQTSVINHSELETNPGAALEKTLAEKRAIKNLFGNSEIISGFIGPKGENEDYHIFVDNQLEAYRKLDLI